MARVKDKCGEYKLPTSGARTVDKRLCRPSQSVDYVELLVVPAGGTDHKIRVKIRSNAYADQSYARTERWDGAQWHFLYELGQGNMKTPISLYTHHPATGGNLEAKFKADRDELVRLAGEILS